MRKMGDLFALGRMELFITEKKGGRLITSSREDFFNSIPPNLAAIALAGKYPVYIFGLKILWLC